MKAHSGGLVAQEELFYLIRGRDGDGRREQMFALPNIAGEHRFGDQPQVEACIVADDLAVEWRIAIDEVDREAELVGIEIAGSS